MTGGFYIDIVPESIAFEKIVISQYELSRNNINFKNVKSVKASNSSIIEAFITSGGEEVTIEGWHSVCFPFNGGTSELIMLFDFKVPFARRRIIFYYDIKPAYWFEMSHPL